MIIIKSNNIFLEKNIFLEASNIFLEASNIFLEASIECVEAVFSVLAEFGINSGFKGNIDKSTCIPLGKARGILLGPNCSLIKKIDTLIFNFLWGSKRDKVKREVIKRKKDEGGLGLFDFSDYLTSMKMNIIKKILNPKFKHSWKSIFVRQFKFPDQIEISVENALTCEKSVIVKNILTTFVQWKNKIVNVKGTCLNHVVWANKSITDIGSQLWNENLIYRVSYYRFYYRFFE